MQMPCAPGAPSWNFFADSTKLDKGMGLITAKLKAFGATVSGAGLKLAALGAAAVAPLAGAAAVYTETASELGKMSQRTGIAVEDLSALSYAASRSGLSAEQLEMGIKKMQKELFAAGQGGAEARKALAGVGVTLQDMKAMTPDQQLEKLADAFKAMDDPTKKTGLALQIFGKAGTDLIPFLNKGSAGIEDLKAEAHKLGIVLSGEDVKAAKEFKAVMAQLKAAALGVTYAIGSAVIPGMTRMRNLIMPVVENITRFARENKGLFDTLFDIATGITLAGAGLVVFGKLLAFVGSGLGTFWALAKSGAAVAVIGFKIFAAAFYALLSPLGLVIAAAAGLTAAFLYLTDAGAQIRESLMGAFAGLGAIFSQAWGGIVNAIKAGELQLAFKIAVEALKVVWFGLVSSLKGAWIDFTLDFRLGLLEIVKNALHAGNAINEALGLKTKEAAQKDFQDAEGLWEQQKRNFEVLRKERKGEIDTGPLEAAKAELNALTGEAARKADAAKFKNAKALQVAMQGAGNVAQGFGESRGALSSFAASRLGAGAGGGVREAVKEGVREQEKTNDLLKKMLDQGAGGLAFS